jgi:hypothetical protein
VALTGLPLRIDPACIRLLAEVEWLDIAVTATGIAITAVLSAAALYFGNNLRRRTRAEVEANVAEKRLPAYAALWERTKIASPMRDTPLTPGERSQLFDDLTDWYYDGGHGMLLTETTRNIYLKAKANLACAPEKLVPDSLRDRVAADGDVARGWASIDQLSLLRTSMRADVEIFTEPYDEELSADDVAFLEACNVDLDHAPWRDATRRKSAHRDG